MKNKTIKKALAIGMSVLMLASTFTPVSVQAAGGWKQNKTGWWWEEDNGSYPTKSWKNIGGTWYYFDGNGYMVTGWLKLSGGWYYLTGSGAMATGWVQVGSTWYYMNESGVMQADTWIGDNYVDESGAWIPGKVKTQAGWIKSGNRWWYRHADGGYTTNGWEMINGTWYYFDGSGWMVTGWKQVNGSWYYMDASGAMVKNAWAGDYYLGADGAMATNTWIGQYYVDGSGKWVPNKQKEPEKQEITLQSISLNQTSLEMWAGESETLEVTYNPSNTTVDKKVTWSSSDKSVATVENGKVKALGNGEATITAEVDGKKTSCTITAKEYYAIRIEYLDYLEFLTVGGGKCFARVFNPDGAVDSSGYDRMYSLNEDIAACEDGYVKGVSDGTATIVVEGNGKIGTTTVEVKTVGKLQAAYFEQGVYSMKTGDKMQLEVNKTPENAYITTPFNCKSSNPEVAEVDIYGVVRAMSEGETEITCMVEERDPEHGFGPGNTNSPITLSCKIKVEGIGDNQELEKIEWKRTNPSEKEEFVKVGDIITPNIQVYPVTYPFNLNDLELTIEKSGHDGPAYDTGFEAEDGIVEILEGNKIKICKTGFVIIKATLNRKETWIRLDCVEN